MDKIKIENLEVFAYHGVFPEENEKGQKFYINAELMTSTREAGIRDDLTLSTNYGEVCHLIYQVMCENTFMLIERAAEKIAERILLTYERVREITVEVRKPYAPIGLPFESVSVEITRKWHEVCIAFGSNMGDRNANIEIALKGIRGHQYCRNMKTSSYYETSPYGGVEQDDFLNGVLTVETLLEPEELLAYLHLLEQKAGRERNIRWGPRTLDLDIIFYDSLVYDSQVLQIPHVDLVNRHFVLAPACELIPWYRHPLTHKTVLEHLQDLKKNNDVKI